MDKINITTLKNVNNIAFGLTRPVVRILIGEKYTSSQKKQDSEEIQNLIDEITIKMAEIEGVSVENFIKSCPDETIFDEITDTYNDFRIEYDENYKFVSIEIFADKKRELTIDNINCSDYSVDTLLSLATDFKWDPENSSYTSLNKQVSIWCPENKNKVETILIAKNHYYE